MDILKEQILDSAKSRFDRFGFQKTSMDEISRDCKISKRTLYEVFHDKQNLYENLIDREARKDLQNIFSRMGEIEDPLARFLQLVRISVAYFNQDIFVTRLLRNDHELFSSLLTGKTHLLITDHLLKIIEDIINDGKKLGRIRADIDARIAAYIGFRLFQAFSYMKSIPFDPAKEQQGIYTEALIDFLYNALVDKQGRESISI